VVNGGTLPGRSIVGLWAKQVNPDVRGYGLLEDSENAIIRQLFGPGGVFKDPVYSMAFEPSGHHGEFLLGALHSGIAGWVPVVSAHEKPHLKHTPELMVHVEGAAVIDEKGNTLLNLPLKYARVDTGNTWLSMPAQYWQTVGPVDNMPGAAGIVLILKNGVTLHFPQAMFSGPIPLANATGFGGMAHDVSLSHDTCVIGNEVMKGMILACNLGTAEVGFGGMCVSNNPHDWQCRRYTAPTH